MGHQASVRALGAVGDAAGPVPFRRIVDEPGEHRVDVDAVVVVLHVGPAVDQVVSCSGPPTACRSASAGA